MKRRFRPFILLLIVLLFCLPAQSMAASLSDVDYIFATTSCTQLPVDKEITWSVEFGGADIANYTVQYKLYRRDYQDTGRDYTYYASGTLTGSSFALTLSDEGRYLLRFDVTDSHGSCADLFGGYYTTIGTYGKSLENAISDIVSEYQTVGAGNDFDKARFVHDYLISNAEYSMSAPRKDDPEGVLLDGKGVCQSYAYAYQMIMKALGVKCILIDGTLDGGDHVWNLVQIGGKWYHVDCTADDPVGGTENDYAFMSPDSAIASTHTWNKRYFPACTTPLDEKYKVASSGGFTFNAGYLDITLSSYTGMQTNLVIPAAINGRKVKRVENNCISSNQHLKNLTISEGVEEVVSLFVQNCPSLESIALPSTVNLLSAGFGIDGLVGACDQMKTITIDSSNPYLCIIDNMLFNKDKTKILYYPPQSTQAVVHIPQGVRTIAGDTFSGNPYLEEVVLPDSIESIGYWAFDCCTALKQINIPNSCTSIGQYAFQGTRLTDIHLPASITSLLFPVFPGTVRSITVDPKNPSYYAEDNVLFNRSGSLLYYAPQKPDTAYTIPSDVRRISDAAFQYASNLKKVIIPRGISEIPYMAFYGCIGLTEIVLPDTVTAIEDQAFFDCDSLKKLVIPRSVTSIGNSILLDVYGAVIFGENGSAAQTWAQNNGYAFHDVNSPWDVSGTCGSNLSWTLSESSVLRISGEGEMQELSVFPWSLYLNYIQTVIVCEGVTTIAPNAFLDRGRTYRHLAYLSLPDSLSAIGTRAFCFCQGLSQIRIPDGVTQIGAFAFYGCERLSSAVIAESVTEIGDNAFGECTNLVISCSEGSHAQEYAVWYNIPYTHTVCAYPFAIPSFVTAIESQAFTGIGASTIYIPEKVSAIADDAFNSGVLIITPAGSYAETWAAQHGFACIPE